MTRRLTFTTRLATASRWPLGVFKTGWDYLWRTTPMHRHEEAGAVPSDLPPALPAQIDRTDMQNVEDGVGPLMHRTYVTRVREARLGAEQLMCAFGERPNRASPTALASFVKLLGEDELRVGDEFTVRMPGPWDGPVRVIEADETSFGFVTLDGHLEAGRIRFSARDLQPPGCLEIRIEAWARGGDRVSNVLFDHVPFNKEVQLHMWTSVLEGLTRLSGGRRDGLVDITTRRVDPAVLAAHAR